MSNNENIKEKRYAQLKKLLLLKLSEENVTQEKSLFHIIGEKLSESAILLAIFSVNQ